MRFHWPIAVVAAVIGSLVVVWFALANPFSDSDGEREYYSEAIIGSPLNVNPLLASLNDVDRDLSSLVFSGLTRLGPHGEIEPDLAESWQVSGDGLTYTFKLRSGVEWQSGVEFTAQDVLSTYSLLAATDFPGDPALSQFWREVNCSAPETLMVECRLPDPFGAFLSSTTIGILPQYALQGTPASGLLDAAFNRSPVGTGPYRLVRISQNSALLERYKAYHLGQPDIEDVEMKFYPDVQSAMAAFFQGDVMGLAVGPNVSQEDLVALTSPGDVRVFTANRTGYTAFYMNNLQPLFSDVRVRQALSYAIDRDAIIGGLLIGRAVRADSPIPPGTWAYNSDIPEYAFNQGKAKSLLDEAGWVTANGGIRQKDNRRLEFGIITDSDPVRRAIAQEISRELAEINVSVTVLSLGSTDLVKDFLLPLVYETAIFGFDPGYDPDPYPAWHSSQTTGEGLNLAGYVSKSSDDILEKARQLTDPQTRRELYLRFQENFAKDAPSLLLYYPVYSYVIDKSVRDVQVGTLFDLSSRFANIHQWKIDSAIPLE